MYSNSRCMRAHVWDFRARKYSSGHKACMLGATMKTVPVNQLFRSLLCVPPRSPRCCAPAARRPPRPSPRMRRTRTRQGQARGGAGANRRAHRTASVPQLKQRDALSARLREAELAIAAKRQRLDELHAGGARARSGAARNCAAEQTRTQNMLQAERASLAAQVRAAYMIGRQEELKLLLNQSNPAGLGRTLAYYGYFAQQRRAKIEAISSERSPAAAHWSRRSSSKPQELQASRGRREP